MPDTTKPTATLTAAPDVSVAGAAAYQFDVTYHDNDLVDATSANSAVAVKVTFPDGVEAPGGTFDFPAVVDVSPGSDDDTIVVTYELGPPPSGTWAIGSNGTYTITLEANQVADATGNYADAKTLGTFLVDISSIIATAKAPNANCYLTRAEADAYLTGQRLNADEWADASGAVRDSALIWAARLLDQTFSWRGTPTDYLNQSMGWPRVGVLDKEGRYVDQNVVPQTIKDATADLALELLKLDRTSTPAVVGLGVRQASLPGPLSVTIDRTMVFDLIPYYILDTLAVYGEFLGRAGGMRVVKLERA